MSKFRPIQFTIRICTDFHENEAKKKIFFLKKKIQNGRFFKMAIFQKNCENFIDWSLGLVGLIDAKGIDVA